MTLPHAHPIWCDPRCCGASPSNLDHRSAPLAWKVSADDANVAVGLSRLDEIGTFETAGGIDVLLTVNVDYRSHDGRSEVGLSPADARMLAAALVLHAERAEIEQRRQARVTS